MVCLLQRFVSSDKTLKSETIIEIINTLIFIVINAWIGYLVTLKSILMKQHPYLFTLLIYIFSSHIIDCLAISISFLHILRQQLNLILN